MDPDTGHNTTILKRRESAGNTAKSMYNLCISLLFTWIMYYQKQPNWYKPLQILPYYPFVNIIIWLYQDEMLLFVIFTSYIPQQF